MKIKKIIYSLFLASLLVSSTSCERTLEDLTENPNSATDVPLSAIFSGTLVGVIQPHSGESARLAGMWTRQFTGTDRQYSSYNNYVINSEGFEWEGFYYAIAEQAKITITKADEQGNGFYGGVAMICRAHAFGTMTSLWGDLPFYEANDYVNFPSPSFDDQMTVYSEVQNMLDDAITLLNSDGEDIDGVDFYFNGSKDAWIAVANTLKARYYLHTGDYANALAATGNGILSGDGDWMIPHFGQYNQNMNLYYSFGTQDRAGYLTAPDAYLPSILDSAGVRNHAKTNETARFNYIYAFDADGNYDLNYADEALWGASASFPLVTAVENWLIAAECNNRLGNGDNGLTELNGVRAMHEAMFSPDTTSTAYAAFDAADFDAGGIEDNGQGGQTGNLLYEIMEEKYTSLVGQIEVFNDLRRSDNILGLTPTTGNAFPERYLYPTQEVNSNTNIPATLPDLFTPTMANQ